MTTQTNSRKTSDAHPRSLWRLVRRILTLHSWEEVPNTRKQLWNGIAYRVVKHATIPNFYRVQRFAGQRWRVVDGQRLQIYEHLRWGKPLDSFLPNQSITRDRK